MDDPVIPVLVVEDEMVIQELVNEALTEAGFAAEMTSSGEDAIALLQSGVGKHRALLTDIDLAGQLSGWDVAKQARENNPDIPVIYMTGGAADQWPSHGVPNSILLKKPLHRRRSSLRYLSSSISLPYTPERSRGSQAQFQN